MVNNMMEFFADVPPLLLAAWGSWFLAGGVLALWYRRATELEYAPAVPRAVTRPKSTVRAAAVPVEPMPEPVDDTPYLDEPEVAAPVAAREKKPVVMGDPFGDLAMLLDQTIAPPAPAVRAPGDSPILSSSGVPFRRANDEPKLG